VGCGAVLAGIGLSKKITFELGLAVLFLLPLLFLTKRRGLVSLLAVVVFGLFLGLWRGQAQLYNVQDLKSLAYQKVTIQGVAKTDSIYGKNSQITFEVGDITEAVTGKPLVGTFSVSGFGEPMVYRGDTVQATGKLYLTRGSKQASISYAEIKTVTTGNDWFAKLRRYFSAGMETALPEPAASLGLGLLIGQRSTLPADVLVAMTTVGLVHIVAVSGYNVTILTRAVQRLKFTRSKFQKLCLALTLIGIFVIITGFSASVVRAAMVSVLSLWAWYYGRTIKPLALIMLVAALTALINPIYVWSDIGWYLSFLAFFGVLIIAPLLGKRILGAGYDSKALSMLIVESFSAQIMTLPLIMMIFGRVSVISLPANLVVVPFIPIAMLFSAVAGAVGALVPAVAGWFSWPATIVLTYIIDITRLSARVPHASIYYSIGAAAMVLVYAILVLLLVGLYRSSVRKKSVLTP